jgi:type IV secretory pathway protease TraF
LSASKPRFALLAPDQDATGWRYKLYVEGDLPLGAAETLDRNLRQNPNYSHCRALGQLHPVEIFHIKSSGYKSFVKRLVSEGKRLGDIKPVPLSSTSGWSQTFVAN